MLLQKNFFITDQINLQLKNFVILSERIKNFFDREEINKLFYKNVF